MRARSNKRARQIAEYRPQIQPFLEANPVCQHPYCENPSVVIHHKRGRFGKRLLDREFWAASCDRCNIWAEEHTGAALEIGWLIPIEGAPR